MKYEVTQSQYADFLNTLTDIQKSMRYPNRFNQSRHFITLINNNFGCDANKNGILNELDDGENIACNQNSWTDGIAYSDWCGLRPMSELEYEKVCRGIKYPIPNEYAWGESTITANPYLISNTNKDNENIYNNYSLDKGNCSYNSTDSNIDGPLRVGIFSSNNNNLGRKTSGASYYGVMELSGNLWEIIVTVGNINGRNFIHLNGDGLLDFLGDANVSGWPDNNGYGSGFRGGHFDNPASVCRVSDRVYAANPVAIRYPDYGFRCVSSNNIID